MLRIEQILKGLQGFQDIWLRAIIVFDDLVELVAAVIFEAVLLISPEVASNLDCTTAAYVVLITILGININKVLSWGAKIFLLYALVVIVHEALIPRESEIIREKEILSAH